jgi:Tol biopolymer transport system component
VDFDHSLNTAVKKLREALGDEAGKPQYIETLPKRGYRFIGEVGAEDAAREDHIAPSVAADDVVRQVVTTLADAAVAAHAESRRRVRRALWGVTISLAVLIAGNEVVPWLMQPFPVPRIVSSRALTRTGYRKAVRQARPVTDGVSVYFQENRPAGLATLQVRLGGGEPSEISVSKLNYGSLRDISPDGSSLLLSALAPETRQWDTWIQPLPTGPARLIVRDARWPSWSPDGSSILFARNTDHDLYRANADGTDIRRLAGFPDITGLAISPDGKRIRFAVLPLGELWESGADGSNLHRILPKLEGGIGNWSRDGRYYFFALWGGDRSDLWVLREPRHWWQTTASAPIRLTFGPMSIGEPTVSRDGRQLLAVGVERHGELSVYDRKSGQFIPYLGGIPACYVDFSKDGKWIAYVSYPEGSLWRSRIDGSERRQLTTAPLAVLNPRWSPDGKLIAFTDYSNGDRRNLFLGAQHRIYMVSADGGAPMLLLAGNLGDPTWSPDGRSIAYDYNTAATPEVRILDLQTQGSKTVPGSQGLWSPRWSPDGKHLAALGAPPVRLGIFSFATEKWETTPGGYYSWPAWSHDGKFVYALNQEGVSLVRFNVTDYRMEQVASLKGFRYTAYFWWNDGWFGLTPDDRPITTRDTGIEEVYAFDLEYE